MQKVDIRVQGFDGRQFMAKYMAIRHLSGHQCRISVKDLLGCVPSEGLLYQTETEVVNCFEKAPSSLGS
jgi:hypothetical protein